MPLLSAMGEGLRRGEGNLSKACHLSMDMALFSQTGLFQTRYLLKALTSDNVLPVLKEPDTAISNSFTRYGLLFSVFDSETFPRRLAVSFGSLYLNI